MGFNRPEAKRLAKAAMRNTNPNPMLVTLVFVLLTTGVSYLVGLVLTNPIYDALYTAYLYLLDGAYARCREILERDRDKLELVAQFLLEHETMDAGQFQLVYDDPEALGAAGGTES